jgi:hypothetical protein
MTAQLSELSAAATLLNKKSEQINARIRELSEQLDAMDIGIEVWLETYLHTGDYFTPERDEDSDGPVNGETIRYYLAEQLGFAKVEDKWQLAVRTATIEDFCDPTDGSESTRLIDPNNVRPLLKAARNLRIASVGLLDALTDEILRRMKAAIAPMAKAQSEGKIASSAEMSRRVKEAGEQTIKSPSEGRLRAKGKS